MVEPTGPEGAELGAATLARLEEELARVREQRHRPAAQLGGEDPDDPDLGDRGDEAVQLEGLADLARMDGRIDELERLIAGPGVPETPLGLADGTEVTLRFPDGDEATFRVVAIPEQAAADDQDDLDASGAERDPALARLLPTANRTDDEAAAEFRRLTETGLRQRKAAALATAARLLRDEDKLRLDAAEAGTVLTALTDVRLVLGERMGVRTDEDVEVLEAAARDLDPDDPLGYALAVYDFLTWLQETLAHALAR